MQRGNAEMPRRFGTSAAFDQNQGQIAEDKRSIMGNRPWRDGLADAFCRCASRKGGPLYPKEEYVNVRL